MAQKTSGGNCLPMCRTTHRRKKGCHFGGIQRSVDVDQPAGNDSTREKSCDRLHVQIELALMRRRRASGLEFENHERTVIFLNDAINSTAEDNRPGFVPSQQREWNFLEHSTTCEQRRHIGACRKTTPCLGGFEKNRVQVVNASALCRSKERPRERQLGRGIRRQIWRPRLEKPMHQYAGGDPSRC